MFEILSTRELSLLLWLALAFILLMFKKSIRGSFLNVLKIIFSKNVGVVLLSLIIYVSAGIIVFYKLRLWDETLLKDTIFWFFTTALVLLFSVNKAKNSNYFKDVVKENLKWAIVTEFIVNFYTFSFTAELFLVPTMIFLGMLYAVAKTDKKYVQVDKMLQNVFALIGLILLFYITYKTFRNIHGIFNRETLFSFLLPPILTVFIIPFLYLLAVFIKYEELFIYIRYLANDTVKKKQLKKQILITGNINLNRIVEISKNIRRFDAFNSTNIKSYVKSLIKKDNH